MDPAPSAALQSDDSSPARAATADSKLFQEVGSQGSGVRGRRSLATLSTHVNIGKVFSWRFNT